MEAAVKTATVVKGKVRASSLFRTTTLPGLAAGNPRVF